MFSIGEFSMATGLTVKTLRFYHEEGLLIPSFVDPQTGYRFYDQQQLETARKIAFLRGLEFPVGEIKEMLARQGDENLLAVMEKQRGVLQEKIKHLKKAKRSLDDFIREEKEDSGMTGESFEVREKSLEPMLIAGVRMTGRYSDCGKGFAKIGKSLGRYISGKPLLLHYNAEYREEEAAFEACMPIREKKAAEGVAVRELPGGPCVSLLHKGPYEKLGHSYAKIMTYAKQKGYRMALPTREVYLKGPGMIFKGNPRNYLTEIEILVETNTDSGRSA